MPFKKYLRECRLNVTKKCKRYFRTKNKSRHKEQQVCNRCRKRLQEFNINVKRYIKMSEEKEERKETIVWEDSNKCTLTIVEDRPIMDGKEVVGRKTSNETYRATKADLEEGIKPLKDMIDRGKEKLAEAQKKIDSLGKKPVKTSEMVRLEKNLDAVMKLKQINQLEAQMKQIQESVAAQEVQYNKRHALLDQAPKA